MITVERLRELLTYDVETGVFRWRASRGGWGAGRIAGRLNTDGYRRVGIDGRQYPAHHLAWLYVHGVWPPTKLDHKSTDRDDNRLENLRPASTSQNGANAKRAAHNTTGFKGVSRVKANGRFAAFIKVNGRSRRVGEFDTPEEAHAAYVAAAREAFGEFARAA